MSGTLCPVFGLLGARKIVTCWSMFSRCHQAGEGAGAYRAGFAQPGEEKAHGRPKCRLQLPDWKIQRRQSQTSLGDTQHCPRGTGHKLKHGKFLLDSRKTFLLWKGTNTIQVAQRGCRVSILRVVEDLAGQDLKQPDLIRPSLNRVLERMNAESPSQT